MNKHGWEPENGKQYYTVLGCGDVMLMQDMGSPADARRKAIGNCFKEIGQANTVARRYQEHFKRL